MYNQIELINTTKRKQQIKQNNKTRNILTKYHKNKKKTINKTKRKTKQQRKTNKEKT